MKLLWKITTGVAVAGAVVALLLLRPNRSEQTAAEETRRALRQQGFKIDLADFNFSIPAELRVREAALTNADLKGAARRGEDYDRRAALREGKPELMAAVGSNSAIVVWKQNDLKNYASEDIWPTLREVLRENQETLDSACEAASSGPIRFGLEASHGNAMLLRHLQTLKNLAQILGTRTVLNLHDENRDAAWRNVLAATRLVTAWEPEPSEVSHLVRFACVDIAYNITWQALQAEGWTDERLASLQREWEAVDFFKGLPEMAAFSRASAVATCQLERQEPLSSGMTFKEMLRKPKYAWQEFTERLRRIRYRNHGSYEDEKALLLHFRDRELELRRAIQSPTWSEMRQLPGVTNLIPFRSKYPSALQTQINLKQLMLSSQMYSSQGPQGRAHGFLGRAAEAAARRQLIITAIGLERYRRAHGNYPKTLPELAPGLVKNPPIDFMDGQPLRYFLTDDGHFVLYSVGLDCTDGGGTMPQRVQWGVSYQQSRPARIPPETDLIWPRPALEREIQVQAEEARQAKLKAAEERDRVSAEQRREEVANRLILIARLERLSAQKPPRRTEAPTYKGQPLSKVLRNERVSGTNQLTLDEMLTLRQITTGKEPDMATFEVPISYDALTNIAGNLLLLVDTGPVGESFGAGAELQDCERATNGNCLLIWNTTYDSPGKHFLQVQLVVETTEVKGYWMPFLSTNLFQLDPFFGHFGRGGAFLQARLVESKGAYTIELKSPSDELLKTFTGTTSNGVIEVSWDLRDNQGRANTNDSFGMVFRVTLFDSGRSQTLKGP